MADGQTGQDTGEARLYWGDSLLCVRHSTPPRPFVLGSEPGRCDFVVPEELLGERSLALDPRTSDGKTLGELRVEVALVAAAERWAGLRRIGDVRIWLHGLVVMLVVAVVLVVAAQRAEREAAQPDYEDDVLKAQLHTIQRYLMRAEEREQAAIEAEEAAQEGEARAPVLSKGHGESYDWQGIPLRYGPPRRCGNYGSRKCTGKLRHLGRWKSQTLTLSPDERAMFFDYEWRHQSKFVLDLLDLRWDPDWPPVFPTTLGVATISKTQGDPSPHSSAITQAALQCYERDLHADPHFAAAYRVRIRAGSKEKQELIESAYFCDTGCRPEDWINEKIDVETEIGSSSRLAACLGRRLALAVALKAPDYIAFTLALTPLVPRDSFAGLGDAPRPPR